MELHSLWYTHSHFNEGGRKTHIIDIDADTNNPLCGLDMSNKLGNEGDEINEDWIATDSGDLCKKCKIKAINLLLAELGDDDG